MRTANCVTCRNTKIERINEALLAGQPVRTIARRYDLSRGAIKNHQARCLPKIEAARAEAAAERARHGPLERLEERIAEAKRIMKQAKAKGNLAVWRQANADVAEMERQWEDLDRSLRPASAAAGPTAVRIRFTTDGRVLHEVASWPIGEEPAAPEVAEERPAAEPVPPEIANEPASPPPVPAPVRATPHVCTATCNPFTCSFQHDAADDAPKWVF